MREGRSSPSLGPVQEYDTSATRQDITRGDTFPSGQVRFKGTERHQDARCSNFKGLTEYICLDFPHYTKPQTTATTFQIPVDVQGEGENEGVREGVDRLEKVKIMLG